MIICLNGHQRSGKTTIARRLITMHGFSEIPLNRPFRDFVLSCIPFSKDSYNLIKDVDLPDRGGKKATVRSLMIEVADLIETYDPAVWARLAVDGITHAAGSRWSFDSIGKLAQWEYLVKNIGEDKLFLIEVVRDKKSASKKVYEDGRDNIALQSNPKRHAVIYNDGDFSRLYDQVAAIVNGARL